ncbi:hypothetical protein C5167_043050 [Papaver somniferum]|uniref:DDRGK domain-containing protein 1 n=1 Tax=Papaver somniferum TaxID=3469 RepID=A0A4Y7L4J9_PAPSO|nr:hypothetical protein C5167_043050 [Papaver somniferum]
MDELLVAILSVVFLSSLIPLFLWKRRQSDDGQQHQHEEEDQVPQREFAVRQPGPRRMRRRPAAGASTSSATSATAEENIDGSDEDVDEGVRALKKKDKKRQEREAQRQADEAARESRNTKQDRYAEMRRKKDEEREEQERLLEEEAKARKAKEEEAAALEFENWKDAFSVDAEGTTESEVQDGSQGLLFDFVEYIKKHKCVQLEDLAAEFKLRTQKGTYEVRPVHTVLKNAHMRCDLCILLLTGSINGQSNKISRVADRSGYCNESLLDLNDWFLDCINRIASLESMGRLSGVMDDRGKYIYIAEEEMRAVADYIRRQGRVSISHLASKSNQFIDLEPKAQFVEEELHNAEGITVA